MDASQAHGSETATTPSSKTAVATAQAPSRGSPLRLGILLLVLAVAIGALVYDFQIAKPGSEAASEKIKNLVETRNQQSVRDSGPVTSADVQKELGRSPTWVEEEPTHTIEWYCWWGKTPIFSTRRHYITVLYTGDKRRFYAQQLNGPIPEEDLPGYEPPVDDSAPLSVPSTGGPPGAGPPGGPPAAANAPDRSGLPPGPPPGMGGPFGSKGAPPGAPPPGMPPGMGGKGKGKGKGKAPTEGTESASPDATPAPASDAPAAKEGEEGAPASAKPAAEGDKPAETSDKPPEKPASDEPAGDKSDADKPNADEPKTEKPAETGDKPAAESAPG